MYTFCSSQAKPPCHNVYSSTAEPGLDEEAHRSWLSPAAWYSVKLWKCIDGNTNNILPTSGLADKPTLAHLPFISTTHTRVKPTPALPCVTRRIIPITPVGRGYGYARLSRPKSLQPESLQSQLYPKQHLASKNPPTQKKEN